MGLFAIYILCVCVCVCVKYLLSSFVHLKNWVVYFLTAENSNIHIFWIQVFCQICDMQTLSLIGSLLFHLLQSLSHRGNDLNFANV